MSERDWATLVGFLVFVGLRFLDYVLPKDGRHFRFIDRWTSRNNKGSKEEE